MTEDKNHAVSAPFAHLTPGELDVALELAIARHRFNEQLTKAYEERNQAIRAAAVKLGLKDVCEISGLSSERIRQITKEHPVRWKRRGTSPTAQNEGKS